MSANAYELDLKNVEKSVINTVRGAIGVSGAVSLIIGVLILVWPVKTAVVVAGIIAVYAVIAGVVNLAIGIFSRRIGGWATVRLPRPRRGLPDRCDRVVLEPRCCRGGTGRPRWCAVRYLLDRRGRGRPDARSATRHRRSGPSSTR